MHFINPLEILRKPEGVSKEDESLRFKKSNEQHGYCELNQLVSYELPHHGIIQLHFPETEIIKQKHERELLFHQAMEILARIIKRNQYQTPLIETNSYFVEENRHLFLQEGFSITNLNEENEKRRKKSLAFIHTNDFIKRFHRGLH